MTGTPNNPLSGPRCLQWPPPSYNMGHLGVGTDHGDVCQLSLCLQLLRNLLVRSMSKFGSSHVFEFDLGIIQI